MSIFGSNTSKKYLNKQAAATSLTTNTALKQINTAPASKILTNAAASIGGNNGPSSLTGGGLGINIGNNNLGLTRSDEVSGLMDNLITGMNTDESAYNDLLGQLTPGFGLVTAARRAAIDTDQQKNISDLNANLARRRIAGSSFANDTVSNANADYAKQKADADAQSFLDELNATQQVLGARTAARQKSIEDALTQSNFETQTGATLLAQVRDQASKQSAVLADLAKTNATLTLNGQIAKAQLVANIADPQLQSYPKFAVLDSQEKGGLGSLFGTVTGALLGGPFGGKLGSTLFGQPATA